MTGTRLGGDANLAPALIQDSTGRRKRGASVAVSAIVSQRDMTPSAKKPPTRACVIPRNLRLQSRAFRRPLPVSPNGYEEADRQAPC
jgi:hypothetical protein